jgi:hypothetical protein
MSNNYKIAVLLPTRGRTETLTRSLIGLLKRAGDLDSIQVLLGLDTDDTVGIKHFQEELQPQLDDLGVHYTAMSFEPMGYSQLHDYVNTLAHNSSADWMFFWNDDAVMETDGWDTVINSYTGQFKLLAVHTHNDHPYSIFPIVPRAWLDVIGHLSLHSMNDAWLSQNAYCVDIYQRIDVHVLHDRADLTGNNLDATYQQRELLEGNPVNPRDFHYPPTNQVRFSECDKLDIYLKSIGQAESPSWWDRVKAGKQDPWQRLQENDPNDQMRQFKINGQGLPA